MIIDAVGHACLLMRITLKIMSLLVGWLIHLVLREGLKVCAPPCLSHVANHKDGLAFHFFPPLLDRIRLVPGSVIYFGIGPLDFGTLFIDYHTTHST